MVQFSSANMKLYSIISTRSYRGYSTHSLRILFSMVFFVENIQRGLLQHCSITAQRCSSDGVGGLQPNLRLCEIVDSALQVTHRLPFCCPEVNWVRSR